MGMQVGFFNIEHHAIAVVKDAIFELRKVFARQLKIHECRAICSNGILGSHSSQLGSASPRICAPCDLAHIWISPSGYS